MLSRIAESLFWIGRYVERADDTARLLDVHVQILLEDPWAEEDLACRSLLSVMDRAPPPAHVEVGREYVLDMLAYDRFAPSSIAGSLVVGAGERPPRPRDHLDRAVGVPQRDLEPAAVAHAAARVRTTTSPGCGSGPPIVAGIMDSATSRDDTWTSWCSAGRSSGPT